MCVCGGGGEGGGGGGALRRSLGTRLASAFNSRCLHAEPHLS